MSTAHKLSLWGAILVNLNIMLGVGIFINTMQLTRLAGSFACGSYVIVGLLLLPLILCIAKLVQHHPSGGLYTFGSKEIGTFIGFLSSWSYFVGKLASATLMVHVASTFLQQLIPGFEYLNLFVLDGAVIVLFCLLNFLNLRTGQHIQTLFLGLKAIPIVFICIAGLVLFSTKNFFVPHNLLGGIATTLPFVLYAFSGFEATCSLSSNIEYPTINGPRSIIISYGAVIIIACVYKLSFIAALGENIISHSFFGTAFSHTVHGMFNDPWICNKFCGILFAILASSSLGGAYSILFSNTWNLHTLARHNHIVKAQWFTTLNRHFIPFGCVIVEALLCFLYLVLSRGVHPPLQQITALGCIISYGLSIIALQRAHKKGRIKTSPLLVYTALGSCALLIASCIRNFFQTGLVPLIYFCTLLGVGISMYIFTRNLPHDDGNLPTNQ